MKTSEELALELAELGRWYPSLDAEHKLAMQKLHIALLTKVIRMERILLIFIAFSESVKEISKTGSDFEKPYFQGISDALEVILNS